MILPTKLGPFPGGNSLLRSPVKQSHASARYNLRTELFSGSVCFCSSSCHTRAFFTGMWRSLDWDWLVTECAEQFFAVSWFVVGQSNDWGLKSSTVAVPGLGNDVACFCSSRCRPLLSLFSHPQQLLQISLQIFSAMLSTSKQCAHSCTYFCVGLLGAPSCWLISAARHKTIC